jgi:hypothetical protein
MVLNPLSIDFDFKFLVQAHEAHESVAAEDGHDRYVPGVFEALVFLWTSPSFGAVWEVLP